MTSGAVEALQADRDALVEICGDLSDAEWHAETGWCGWSVQGLVSHMAGAFWQVVDRAQLPDTAGVSTQEAQEMIVASRRSWSSDRVLDDYCSVSTDAIAQLARLEGNDEVIPYGDLGRYPASMVPNSFAFDHYTHLRADLCAPRGPLDAPAPPTDELRLMPALDWVAAALPQQNADLVESLDGSVVIQVTGTGARTLSVGSGPTAATIESDAASLLAWVTQRWCWNDVAVTVEGDPGALELARQLRVS
jgi:uncharacterized protein (TIGR03083 family)